MPAERKPGLIQRAKELVKPTHRLDDPAYREDLASRLGIELIGEIPKSVMDGRCVVLSNYIGTEEPFVEPTIKAFLTFAHHISKGKEKNIALGVGRPNTMDGIRDEEIAKAAMPFLVLSNKKGESYVIGLRGRRRIGNWLDDGGVFCATPAATTDKRGFILNPKSGVTRIAMEKGYSLAVLAIETSDREGQELIPSIIRCKEIDLPKIFYDGDKREKRRLHRIAYRAITLKTMGENALQIPKENKWQRGEFEDPQLIMDMAKYTLLGLEKDGLYVVGGFMDQI